MERGSFISYIMAHFLARQNFVAADQFCFRACQDGPQAPALCEHIYDVMGCAWNMPGNYGTGFDTCKGDSGEVSLIPEVFS